MINTSSALSSLRSYLFLLLSLTLFHCSVTRLSFFLIICHFLFLLFPSLSFCFLYVPLFFFLSSLLFFTLYLSCFTISVTLILRLLSFTLFVFLVFILSDFLHFLCFTLCLCFPFLFLRTSGKRGVLKRPWSEAERAAVESHLVRNIMELRVPAKADCERCLEQCPLLVTNHRDWRAIKFYCHNRIQLLKKTQQRQSPPTLSVCWDDQSQSLLGKGRRSQK